MSNHVGVPVIVLSRRQDQVEAVNRALRDARHPAYCTWLSDPGELGDGLAQLSPELLFYFADDFSTDVATVVAVREHNARGVPILSVRRQVDEQIIARDLDAGAQDVVSLVHPRRLQAVASRELKAFRLARALNVSRVSAHQYRQQLQAFLEGAVDAIATVQEGIVVAANPAWLELFGFAASEALEGEPLMDLFEPESHAALKGALVASAQNRWEDQALRVKARGADGSPLPLELRLESTRFEGEPAVQLCVPRERAEDDNPGALVAEIVQKDPATGLYHRRHLIEAIELRLGQPIRGGVRALVWLRPDKLLELRTELGPLATESLLDAMARLVATELGPADLAGRITGNGLAILIERGTLRDCEEWAGNLLRKVSSEVFEVGQRSLTLTISIGLAASNQHTPGLDALLDQAERCCREARARGNCLRIPETLADDTRAIELDALWVQRIRAALMENRFRLVQQPIASLQDSHQGLYDMLVRMLAEDDSEILPGEFLPAAQRHRLLKNIDRWVIATSVNFAVTRKPSRVFVRLSADSVLDPTLPAWLQNQLRSSGVPPQRLCFQLTEEVCHQHLKQAKALAEAVRRIGCQFAVEHFGTGRDPLQVLRHLPMNYVKIDGSLMQGLAGNERRQEQVRALVAAAREHKALTIAERVEDANTLAVLFQLGVSYVQGHYVQEPEVVLEDPATAMAAESARQRPAV